MVEKQVLVKPEEDHCELKRQSAETETSGQIESRWGRPPMTTAKPDWTIAATAGKKGRTTDRRREPSEQTEA